MKATVANSIDAQIAPITRSLIPVSFSLLA
jgi:hypothetical protein